MATQPSVEPDHIEPQSPPEAPPAAPELLDPFPDETQPLDPDIVEPGSNPEEWPGEAGRALLLPGG